MALDAYFAWTLTSFGDCWLGHGQLAAMVEISLMENQLLQLGWVTKNRKKPFVTVGWTTDLKKGQRPRPAAMVEISLREKSVAALGMGHKLR